MITPTVTEIARALEPVGRDTFMDGADDPAPIVDLQSHRRCAATSSARSALSARAA